tara:strand:- start:62 stop:325 length:264 start_codon:yes stop_codon:yes gene_type:complete
MTNTITWDIENINTDNADWKCKISDNSIPPNNHYIVGRFLFSSVQKNNINNSEINNDTILSWCFTKINKENIESSIKEEARLTALEV